MNKYKTDNTRVHKYTRMDAKPMWNTSIKSIKGVHKDTNMYVEPVWRVNKAYVDRCSTVCTRKGFTWLESAHASEGHLLVCLKSKKRCVTYHKYRKVAKNTKYSLQKYGARCKYGVFIVKLRCDVRSDVAVLFNMDKAAKMELNAEVQGERVMNQPAILSSNGKLCPSMHPVPGDIYITIANKPMFNPNQVGIVLSCCLFKVFPGKTRVAHKTYKKPLMPKPVTSKINIYQCDLTKCTLNPNSSGIVVNCCLFTPFHSQIVLAQKTYMELGLPMSVTFKIIIYQCYLIKYMFNPNLSGIVYTCCLLSFYPGKIAIARETGILCSLGIYQCYPIKYMFNPNLSGIVYNCCLLPFYLGKIAIARKFIILCSLNPTCVCVVFYVRPWSLIHRGGYTVYNIVTYVKASKLSNWKYRYRE
jgi:hypothetical protein